MAKDRISDHYTSASTYKDLNGMHKNFTFIDHDKKPTISTSCLSEQEVSALKNVVKDDIKRSIDQILALPAVSALSSGNFLAEEYIERNVTSGKVVWREEMVREALTINHNLRRSLWNDVWKNTVKEPFWFEDMSYEDIMAGKWRDRV